MKYFINYKDAINENLKVDKNKLFILKKNNGKIKIYPLCILGDIVDFLLKLDPNRIDNSIKGSLALEIDEKELKDINPFIVHKYIKSDEKTYENIENRVINLINYNAVLKMSIKEMNEGKLLTVIRDNDNFIIDENENIINYNRSINETRRRIKEEDVINDIYLYTTNYDLLDKYSDDVTKIRKTNKKYTILQHKFFAIDSIGVDRVVDLTNETYKMLNELCYHGIPIYYDLIDDINCNVYTKRDINNKQKAYLIMNSNINEIFYNKSILPIIKYINIFEYIDGFYKRISLEDYLKDKNILKYIKKNR